LKRAVAEGQISNHLLSLTYINDLSEIINGTSKRVSFSGDTSIIFTNSNFKEFKNYIKLNLNA
jgi:hypothetical protein